MKKVLLRVGIYGDVTESGQDGTTIQFPFVMVVSSMVGTPEESKVTTSHVLRVGSAARISWGDDKVFLARVLFAVGKQRIVDELFLLVELPPLITAFVPHGECPVAPEILSDPEGAIVEIEIP
jgi:hypothetical protein